MKRIDKFVKQLVTAIPGGNRMSYYYENDTQPFRYINGYFSERADRRSLQQVPRILLLYSCILNLSM